MVETGFAPLTSQLGIPGTSYRLQLGLINEKWASRILKGKDVIDSYVYKDEDTTGGFPNQNLIVGWVLRTVAIPNINPHQVMKTTQALVKQAIDKKQQRSVKAPIMETKEIQLEKVPQSELKRPKTSGWVVDKAQEPKRVSEEDTRKAFQQTLQFRKEQEAQTPTIKRDLPSIPSGDTPQVTSGRGAESSLFCPHCGKDLSWKFCPYCGKPLPH